MDMNSGKSMDDILDSIRRIVHEEETGDAAPQPDVARTETRQSSGGDMDTLVLTREMRVDDDATLNLSQAEKISDEEIEAIAALRLDPASAEAEEDTREAVATLRMDRKPADDGARDEIAAFDAALAEDEPVEDAASAMDETAAEEDAEERDEYGFAIPPAANPLARAPDDLDEPRNSGFALHLNRAAPAAEAPEAAPDGSEREEAGEAIFASGAADAPAEESVDALSPPGSRAEIERIVRSAVREELSGALGDKITRNIRGMVRREIQRVMETKQIK